MTSDLAVVRKVVELMVSGTAQDVAVMPVMVDFVLIGEQAILDEYVSTINEACSLVRFSATKHWKWYSNVWTKWLGEYWK